MSECRCQHYGCCRNMPADATEAQRIEGPVSPHTPEDEVCAGQPPYPEEEKAQRAYTERSLFADREPTAAARALFGVLEALEPIDSAIVRRRVLRAAAVYWAVDMRDE